MARRNRGAARAAKALATAGGVAHVAFLGTFAYRMIIGGGIFGRYAAMLFALLAAFGLAADVVGWMLVKHGGRTPAARVGMWAIALSTGLAAVLLVVA